MTYKNGTNKFTLSQKIVLLITFVIVASLLPASLLIAHRVSGVVDERISVNAVSITTLLSHSPAVIRSLTYETDINNTNETLNNVVNMAAKSCKASIIILDRNKNIRVFHNPTSIDGFEDEARQIVAEQGLSTNLNWYDTSVFNEKAVGVIRDDRNTVVGYIVAGVSPKMIQDLTVESVLLIFLASLFGLFVGIGGAVFLARHVKATLFGLEPEDIATLLQERNALLNSVKEGVVAINKDAEITLINTESEFLFAQAGIPNPHTLLGKPLETVMNGLTLDTVLKEGRATLDMPVQVGSVLFIATLVPLFDNGHIGGAIITFRKKTELEELANQLTGVRNYADALRAQTHEFMNKMHVIMGLIDMKAYDELKQFTMEIANNRQAEAAYVVTRLKDITLAGFILGKISRARELDIEFSLTDESELTTEFIRPTVQELILIIGNLIENAFDVLRDHPSERIVNLSILTFDNEIERTNYMEAFCREYSVRTEDFKKLVAYHSARMVGIDYEKRRQERMVKTARQKEDGIAKSQGVFLTWLSNDPVLFEKTKGILSAEDFVDEPYHEVAQMIYEQYETTGKVEPAMIISKFQSKEEQSLVAGIFNKELKEISKDTEQQKALNEVVHSIKKYRFRLLSKTIVSGEFRYFGFASPITRPPKAITRLFLSKIGNITRFQNLSYTPRFSS